jgi:hypothetical protein
MQMQLLLLLLQPGPASDMLVCPAAILYDCCTSEYCELHARQGHDVGF